MLLHVFKGRCRNCGEYGHKSVACRKKKGGGNDKRKTVVCHHCKRPGHLKRDCYKLKNAKQYERPQRTEEFFLVANDMYRNVGNDMWFADSGASKHMINDPRGLFNIHEMDEEIIVGNNQRLTCKVKGKLRVKIQLKDKSSIKNLLNEVLHIPGLKHNLFSLSNVTRKKEIKVKIEGDKVRIGGPTWGPWPIFERSAGETLYYMKCKRVLLEVAEYASLEKAVNANLFHERLGHPSQRYTEETARQYGVKLKGRIDVWESCTMGKGSQKPMKKNTETRAKEPYERLWM